MGIYVLLLDMGNILFHDLIGVGMKTGKIYILF
jgi:hypothetical protein